MAELLGAVVSGVPMAALFKTCIEAFNLIQTCRHQEGDFKKLKLRLNIEKCRLYTWGEAMGLTDTSEVREDRPIDKVRFPDMVRDILEAVSDLFRDSQRIRERYGCKEATPDDYLDTDPDGPIQKLAASFSNFAIRPSHHPRAPAIIKKMIWVISDCKKFGALVTEIKDLVDSLQGITSPTAPVDRQKGKMKKKIVKIHDAETLSAIAEVCSEDHPDVADAASTRAESMSLTSSLRNQILAWTEDVQEARGEGERTPPDLESLTVAELRQKLSELLQERRERDKPSIPAPNPSTAPPGATNSTRTPKKSTTISQSHSRAFPSLIYTKPDEPDFHARSNFPESIRPLPSAGVSLHTPSTAPTATSGSDNWLPHGSRTQSTAPSDLYPTTSDQQSLGHWCPRDSFAPKEQQVQRKRYQFPTASSLSSTSAGSLRTQSYSGGRPFAHVIFFNDSFFTAEEEHALYDLDAAMRKFNTAPHRHWRTHDCKVCSECFLWSDQSWKISCGHFKECPFACVVNGCDRHFPTLSNLRPQAHREDGEGELYRPAYSTSSASGKSTFPW